MNFEALFNAVSIPTWLAVVGAFAAILLLLMLFRPNAERDPLMLFAQFALVAVVGKLSVLYFGKKVAEGDPQEVMASADVRQFYIGLLA